MYPQQYMYQPGTVVYQQMPAGMDDGHQEQVYLSYDHNAQPMMSLPPGMVMVAQQPQHTVRRAAGPQQPQPRVGQVMTASRQGRTGYVEQQPELTMVQPQQQQVFYALPDEQQYVLQNAGVMQEGVTYAPAPAYLAQQQPRRSRR